MLKLLLAMDGSEPSLRAGLALIENARLYRDPVHVDLVTVNLPMPSIGGLFGTDAGKQLVDQDYRDEGSKAIRASETMLSDAAMSFTTYILTGNIAETIIEHADTAQCRMIYMGTRGMSALVNMVMGSVATKVVHLARVPVVLVH